MQRKLTYEIPIEYDGKKIYAFLRDRGFSYQNLTDIRFKGYELLVDSQRVYRNHVLKQGNILEINIDEQDNSQKIEPVELPLQIVYEDEDCLVIDKPPFMPIHPSMNNHGNSLANAVMFYYNSRNIPFVYRVINRLDRDTSGLTLIAKNSISANLLGEQQKNGQLHKEYTAIVSGIIEQDTGTIDLPIGRKEGSTIERIIDYEKGKTAVTNYSVINRYKDYSLIKLVLETGRTHQIRVHMKAIGHPLIGDFLYNSKCADMNRQALHVNKLEFVQPITGETITLISPLPNDMQSLLAEENK